MHDARSAYRSCSQEGIMGVEELGEQFKKVGVVDKNMLDENNLR